MRQNPLEKYMGMPCSYVAAGCAYENIEKRPFTRPLPETLRPDGYLTLKEMNRYIRFVLPIRKKEVFKRGERLKLRDFLAKNSKKCCICVKGHFLYANGPDYWSFFPADDDDVVCVWYIRCEK